MNAKPPLSRVRVIDFSTLLPGPLATLVLAEAGAEVVKIERPDGGDDQRRIGAPFGDDHVGIALLNRGTRSVATQLQAAGAAARMHPPLGRASGRESVWSDVLAVWFAGNINKKQKKTK